MLERNPTIEPEKKRKSPRERPPLRGELGDLDFLVNPPSFHSGPQRPRNGWVVMAWSLAATVIDALVVLSLACVFLFVSLLLQRLQVSAVSIDRASFLRIAVALFAFLHSSYLVLVRIFLGGSLGEWACQLRLGEPRQRFSSRYALWVLARFFLVAGTGVITLPLISICSGVDWAGRLSGVSLISVARRSAK